jgi:hypothetical protein
VRIEWFGRGGHPPHSPLPSSVKIEGFRRGGCTARTAFSPVVGCVGVRPLPEPGYGLVRAGRLVWLCQHIFRTCSLYGLLDQLGSLPSFFRLSNILFNFTK